MIAMSSPDTRNPGGRYDEEGHLYLDLGEALLDSPILPLVRLSLTSDIPAEAFDWHPGGDLVWVRFDHARTVERRLRRMWPDVEVAAVANPDYTGPAVPR